MQILSLAVIMTALQLILTAKLSNSYQLSLDDLKALDDKFYTSSIDDWKPVTKADFYGLFFMLHDSDMAFKWGRFFRVGTTEERFPFGKFFGGSDCQGGVYFPDDESDEGINTGRTVCTPSDRIMDWQWRLLANLLLVVATTHPILKCRKDFSERLTDLGISKESKANLDIDLKSEFAPLAISCLEVEELSIVFLEMTEPFFCSDPDDICLGEGELALRECECQASNGQPSFGGVCKPDLSDGKLRCNRDFDYTTYSASDTIFQGLKDRLEQPLPLGNVAPHFEEFRMRNLLSHCKRSEAPYPCTLWTLFHSMAHVVAQQSQEEQDFFLRTLQESIAVGFFVCLGCINHWQHLWHMTDWKYRNTYMNCIESRKGMLMTENYQCRLAQIKAAEFLDYCHENQCDHIEHNDWIDGFSVMTPVSFNWGHKIALNISGAGEAKQKHIQEANEARASLSPEVATKYDLSVLSAADDFETFFPITDQDRLDEIRRKCAPYGLARPWSQIGQPVPMINACDTYVDCNRNLPDCKFYGLLPPYVYREGEFFLGPGVQPSSDGNNSSSTTNGNSPLALEDFYGNAPDSLPGPHQVTGEMAKPEEVIFLAHNLARLGRITDVPIPMVSFDLQEQVLRHYAAIYESNPKEEEQQEDGNEKNDSSSSSGAGLVAAAACTRSWICSISLVVLLEYSFSSSN